MAGFSPIRPNVFAETVRAQVALWRPPFVADVHRAADEHGQAGKCASRVAPVLEIQVRHAPVAASTVAGAERHDLVGLVEGKPRKNTAFTRVNTVLFAPMPSARVIAATSVNPRSFARTRSAYRTSCNRFIGCPAR